MPARRSMGLGLGLGLYLSGAAVALALNSQASHGIVLRVAETATFGAVRSGSSPSQALAGTGGGYVRHSGIVNPDRVRGLTIEAAADDGSREPLAVGVTAATPGAGDLAVRQQMPLSLSEARQLALGAGKRSVVRLEYRPQAGASGGPSAGARAGRSMVTLTLIDLD